MLLQFQIDTMAATQFAAQLLLFCFGVAFAQTTLDTTSPSGTVKTTELGFGNYVHFQFCLTPCMDIRFEFWQWWVF